MSEAVTAAVITGLCAIAAQLVISFRSGRELVARLEKHSELSDAQLKGEIAVIKTELADLRQEVAKHNGVIERTYALERQTAVHAEQIKVVNHRLEDLEKLPAG